MLSETLSPAWCETLLFDRILLEGTPEELKRDPPLIIVNIYSYDSMVALTISIFVHHNLLLRIHSFLHSALLQGGPKPLGRAFAEPEFKTVEQYYRRPNLRFYDINMGRARAGELLGAFEFIELDYSGFGEVTPKSNFWDF